MLVKMSLVSTMKGVCVLLVLSMVSVGDGVGLGVNYGTLASHPLPAATIVQLMRDNGIKNVKLFDADAKVLQALCRTNIEVIVGIPNTMLQNLAYDPRAASYWVSTNVSRWIFNGGVNIKYVAVGNEPFLDTYNNTFLSFTFPALRNIQLALNNAGLDVIKATVPLNADVYNSPDTNPLPSQGFFRPNIREAMLEIIQFLHENQAPFVINIYPFLSLYDNQYFPLDFAFFEGANEPLLDGGLQYSNAFEASFDTLAWCLRKAGYPDMPIIVGEVGWPTDGDVHACPAYAQKFNQGLIKHVMNGKRTPMGYRPMELYLFSLIDEDRKTIAPGNFERHWGIFGFDGQPKYPLDLPGSLMMFPSEGLVGARDVKYLPRRWCVLKPDAEDMSELLESTNYACSFSDCTSLGYGSSCGNLSINGNASYAFNMYYQVQNQKSDDCGFSKLATISMQDPSIGDCKFQIMISSGCDEKGLLSPFKALMLALGWTSLGLAASIFS